MGFRDSWISFWTAMQEWDQQVHKPWPKCLSCGNRNFLVLTAPTFSVDNWSRARVKCLVACTRCGMRFRAMREGRGKWQFNLRG